MNSPLIDHRAFRAEGYWRMSAALDEHDLTGVDRLLDAAERDLALRPASAPTRLDRIIDRAPDLRRAIFTDRVLPGLQALIGADIALVLNRHNHYTSARSERTPSQRAHRDVRSWTRNLLTVVVYLELPSGEGWPAIIPGSHLCGVEGPSNGGGYWASEDSSLRNLLDQAVRVPVGRGDILIMDGFLVHAAGRGTAEVPRRALTFAVTSHDELLPMTNPEHLPLTGHGVYRGRSVGER